VSAQTLPAVLLVLVALVQIGLTRTSALTPWKGGGFGMFATLDHGAFRRVEVVIDGPDRSETLEIPPSLEELSARVANMPADWLLRRLGEGVVQRERRYQRPVSKVTITVWRARFAPVTLHAEEQTLRKFEYLADPAPAPPGGYE
jgi:hypothetical protein